MGGQDSKIPLTRCRLLLCCFISHKNNMFIVLSQCCCLCLNVTSFINTGGTRQGEIILHRGYCATFTRELGKEVTTGEPAHSQNVWTCCREMWESSGRTPEECTCARTRKHTTPLLAPFAQGCDSTVTEDKKKGPWYSWSSARKEKRVKGRLVVAGRCKRRGRTRQGNRLVIGRRDCFGGSPTTGKSEEHKWETVATRRSVICSQSQITPRFSMPVCVDEGAC